MMQSTAWMIKNTEHQKKKRHTGWAGIQRCKKIAYYPMLLLFHNEKDLKYSDEGN